MLSEDAQEIVIQDDDDDINETARELDLDVNGVDPTGEAPAPQGGASEESFDEDGDSDDASDDTDIIADLGNMDQDDNGEVDPDDNSEE